MSKIPKPPPLHSLKLPTTTLDNKKGKKFCSTKEVRKDHSTTKRKSVENHLLTEALSIKKGENLNPPNESKERARRNPLNKEETKQNKDIAPLVDPPSKLPLMIYRWRKHLQTLTLHQ